jgi:replication factor C subunit 3/5
MQVPPPQHLPWIEKFRPKHLDEIVDHADKIRTLRGLIDRGELPHLLFTGPAGTGKTSLILCLARYMYGADYPAYIKEINGSSDRGIDTVRNTITDFIQARSAKVKILIIDEADAMTSEAQGALKSVIEKGTANCRFCLICNDVNKIIPALQSRCTKFPFSYLSAPEMKRRLLDIVQAEQVAITEPALDVLLDGEQDFRKILNILQSMSVYYRTLNQSIDTEQVLAYLGRPTEAQIQELITALFTLGYSEARERLQAALRCSSVTLENLVRALAQQLSVMSGLSDRERYLLLETLSDVERKTRVGCDLSVLVCYLVSAFLKVRADRN